MNKSNTANPYRPAIPRRVDHERLISEISEFFRLPRDGVVEMFLAYRSIYANKGYAELLGERKTLCFEEAFIICVVLAATRPRTIIEIGAGTGASTRRLIDIARVLGLDSRVITFDVADRVRHFSPSEANLILEDVTGRFSKEVLEKYRPGFVFLNAHPFNLIKDVVTQNLGPDGRFALAIHDCSRGLCNPHMTISRSGSRVTSSTGCWQRHVLAEAFGIDDPLSEQLDSFETAANRCSVFGTPHGLAVLVPKSASYAKATDLTPRLRSHSSEKPTVAVGPARPGRGSWQWVGADIQKELSRYFQTVSFCQDWRVPECGVLIAVKHRPPLELVERVRHRTQIIYCPLDYFPSAARIESYSETLKKCQRIVVHCHRLRRHFEQFAPVEYMDHHLKYVAPLAERYKSDGFILWTGARNNLWPLIRWVNRHPLAYELRVLTNLPQLDVKPTELGFRSNDNTRLESWSPEKHFRLASEAKAAIDVKGGTFLHQHKPPAKALDFLASGIPLAMNPESSPVEHLARMGFQVASPSEPDRWFSQEYWEETNRFGRAVRELLSIEQIGLRYKRLIEEVLSERKRFVSNNQRGVGRQARRLGSRVQVTNDRQPNRNSRSREDVSLSVVVTAYNEGEEVQRTVESIRANTREPHEIIIVDDGSTDASCDHLESEDIRILRNDERKGVAYSRNAGCAVAKGDVFAFLDAHQRVGEGCLDLCAQAARKHSAIIWPDVRGLEDQAWTGHGASLELCEKRGYFQGRWKRRPSRERLSRITGLIVPGYVMPREVYERVPWIRALRGWGASEAAITVKAFFLDIQIFHLCGPLTRHMFRKNIPYSTPWASVWRNHALIARVCFDDATWFEHWLPRVFDGHLTDESRRDLESDDVLAEHEAFLAARLRTDREFWQILLGHEEPACLRA